MKIVPDSHDREPPKDDRQRSTTRLFGRDLLIAVIGGLIVTVIVAAIGPYLLPLIGL